MKGWGLEEREHYIEERETEMPLQFWNTWCGFSFSCSHSLISSCMETDKHSNEKQIQNLFFNILHWVSHLFSVVLCQGVCFFVLVFLLVFDFFNKILTSLFLISRANLNNFVLSHLSDKAFMSHFLLGCFKILPPKNPSIYHS